MRLLLLTAVIGFLATFLSACNDSQYLAQCIQGQWDLISRAEPIEDILDQKSQPENVQEQLTKVVKIREFAVNSLSLPDSGSYRSYVDLERPYVVWNVVAAPEFSLDLNQWCFPIVGCVTYRGYFDEMAAKGMARTLSEQGFDVDVYGVQAYSTLNWFDDPVLNTFLAGSDLNLAKLLFHEMSHQVVYVQDDTVFNESFAKTVEREGLRRWLQTSGSSELWQEYLQRDARAAEFNRLLGDVRDELRQLYALPLDTEQKRLSKQSIIAHAFDEYERLKENWGGDQGFDAWMQGGLNNARLSSIATYYELVPAFQRLLREVDDDLGQFYTQVRALGALDKEERSAMLKQD